MDQTENEFGILHKNPEMKTEEQRDAEQPASGEQPEDNNEAISEDVKEMLAECEKSHRRQYLLEKLLICVVVMIAASVVGWLVTGKWFYAANNLLWLFIAWMYWRQEKVRLSAAEFIVHLLREMFNLTKQVEHYDEMVKVYGEKDELWQELQRNHEKLIANLEKSNDLRQQIIEKQEQLINIKQ